MKTFITDTFLLRSSLAEELYVSFARDLPIIDYHNHLSPADIAQNVSFPDLTRAWLDGDHYKWRAMRIHGVSEAYCTGSVSAREKFHAWSETVPFLLRNPLYHWTHLELLRYFNEDRILNPSSADSIFDRANDLLAQPEYTTQGLLRKMRVEVVCTTDDPADELTWHQRFSPDQAGFSLYPAFRADGIFRTDEPALFNQYVDKLEAVSNTTINSFNGLLEVLKLRHDAFHAAGCRLADYGLTHVYWEPHTDSEVAQLFTEIRGGKMVSATKQRQLVSALLFQLAAWAVEKDWVQQFHLGAMRNNNSRMRQQLGADTGWDSIGDYPQSVGLARFLDTLDQQRVLGKTILYNLNPADNAVFATMLGNFSYGGIPGKIQWGSAWWFLDQQDGIKAQLNDLSRVGLLAHFVGMLTDSRSFLSFPRHEYFRRILCNLLADDMLAGELPHDISLVGQYIRRICYDNAAQYFNFNNHASIQ